MGEILEISKIKPIKKRACPCIPHWNSSSQPLRYLQPNQGFQGIQMKSLSIISPWFTGRGYKTLGDKWLMLLLLWKASAQIQGREGNGTPLQYSCLENPMDTGSWWAAVHGVAKSRTRLSNFTFTFHCHALEKEMATHSSVLAWRIPGMEEPGGCRLWGHTESDTTEVT